MIGEDGAGPVLEAGPGAVGDFAFAFRIRGLDFCQVHPAFVRHFEEQQIGELLDVIAVVDPIVAQGKRIRNIKILVLKDLMSCRKQILIITAPSFLEGNMGINERLEDS